MSEDKLSSRLVLAARDELSGLSKQFPNESTWFSGAIEQHDSDSLSGGRTSADLHQSQAKHSTDLNIIDLIHDSNRELGIIGILRHIEQHP